MQVAGVAEVAAELEVSRQRLLKLREREDFPAPIQELAQGPIWDLDAIRRWNGSGVRTSAAGRPRSEVAARTLGGRFVLEEKIGTGGFADVWRATDRRAAGSGADVVAVKVLHGIHMANPDYVARFRRERELLLKLDHPHIMKLHASEDLDDGRIWMAMALAQRSLAEERDHFVGNPVRINDLFKQICAGVEYLHANGILHRDLTPGNVLLTAAQTWAISDFGLAVEVARTTRITPQKTHYGVGTDDYAAPEQRWRALDATEAADIYSLGKILQELVTGRPPVGAMTGSNTFRAVIDTATSAEPDDRYPSVAAFRTAMQRALEAEATASWEAPTETAERLLERIRLARPAAVDLDELLTWAGRLDDRDHDEKHLLVTVLPRLSKHSVSVLWRDRHDTFLHTYLRYARIVEDAGLNFSFCNVVADFGAMVVGVTEDAGVLRATISSLCEMGHQHNRWHVRGVVTSLLQAIRTHHDAIAAVEGLAEASDDAVTWTLSDFTLRSLHPHLREHLASRLGNAEPAPDDYLDDDDELDLG